MSKRQNFVIAGKTFPTKIELQEFIKGILYQYQDGQHLSDSDFEFMLEVLKHHPDFKIKNGVGIKAIFVKQNPVYKSTRCFWILRQDDSETDFSYLECLKATSHEKKFINACRSAIEPYTQEFKRNFFDGLKGEIYHCPYTNEPLSFLGSHVDHKKPKTFQQIVNNFLKEYAIDVNQVKIKGSEIDNEYQDTFEDEEIKRLWVAYHNLHAELRIISAKANLSLIKKDDAA